MNEHLSHLAKLACEFLVANGGMSNGYVTYVKGRISASGAWGVEVKTPHNMDDMTQRQIKDRDNKLTEELQAYCRKHKLDGEFVFRAEHIEWGCYKTFVEYTESYRAW